MNKSFTLSAPHLSGGYHAQVRNRKPEEISRPSKNIRYTKIGGAEARKGFEDQEWDLNVANSAFIPHHSKRFNVTFFAGGQKLKYVNHNNADAVVDTGISLTSGTVTRMVEHAGMLFLTNPTDGLTQIVMTRLNGDVALGGNIIVDLDGAVLLDRFSLTSKNIRINGTNEAYTTINTTTGALAATASAAYDDNTFAIVVNAVSTAPKCSKYVVWKSSLNGIGMNESAASASYDIPKYTMVFGDFAPAATIEDLIDFAAGLSGAEPVNGELTNVLALEGYLVLFTKEKTYTIAVSDVNTTTGARPPEFYTNAGCINEDCAVEMDGDLVWASPDGRVFRASRAIVADTPVLQLDQRFDTPILEDLAAIDATQPNALMHYWKKGKLLFYQVSIDSETKTFVFDNDKGIWCPPDTNKSFAGYFEIDGDLYATDAHDDTIYQVETGVSDDGADIPWVIATGVFTAEGGIKSVDNGIMEFLGEMTQPATVYYYPILNGVDGNEKTIPSSYATFTSGVSIGSTPIPFSIGGGGTFTEFGSFKFKTAVVPAYSEEFQHVWYSNGDNHRFRIKNWKQTGAVFSDSLITTR